MLRGNHLVWWPLAGQRHRLRPIDQPACDERGLPHALTQPNTGKNAGQIDRVVRGPKVSSCHYCVEFEIKLVDYLRMVWNMSLSMFVEEPLSQR